MKKQNNFPLESNLKKRYDSYRDELFSQSTSSLASSSSSSASVSQSRSTGGNGGNSASNSSATDKNNNNGNKSSQGSSSNIKSSTDLDFDDQLEFWPPLTTCQLPKFVKIGAMQSELVALGKDGCLYQWRWRVKYPYFARLPEPRKSCVVFHPKTCELDLVGERVVGLSTSSARATVWTESGKLASWLDESVESASTRRFETRAHVMSTESSSKDPERSRSQQPTLKDAIVETSTTGLFSLVRLAGSGLVYWWGVQPHEQRAKSIEKYVSKSLKARQEVTSALEFGVGSVVSLKSAPLLHAGSIAIAFRDGPNSQPCLVQLREHIFHYRDTRMYKFRIIKSSETFSSSSSSTSLVLDHQQSSTSKEIGEIAAVTEPGSLKRKEPPVVESFDPDDVVEHSWYLHDVVFVEDARASQILGRVIKVNFFSYNLIS